MRSLIKKGRIADRVISLFNLKSDRHSRELINAIVDYVSGTFTSTDFNEVSHAYEINVAGDITLLSSSIFIQSGVTRFDITNRTQNSLVKVLLTPPDVFTYGDTSFFIKAGENVTLKVYEEGKFNVV